MSLSLFLPETILLALSVTLLCFTLAKREIGQAFLQTFMTASALLLLGASLHGVASSGSLFFGTYKIDLLSQGFKIILSLAFLITILLSKDALSMPSGWRVEYFIFLSSSLLGMMMMASAVDILTLYVSLELATYSLYLLAALRIDAKNAESNVKYLIFGAAASGVFLWGASLLIGLSGTASIFEIAKHSHVLLREPAFVLGLLFMSFAFLFKLSAFPLHFWAPDVYECASTPVTNFIATASKGAAIAILIRVLMLTGIPQAFVAILTLLAFVSMTLGNSAALVQQDVKRLLAYSSIAQAGYILTGLLAGSFEGFSSAFFYAFAYILMNSGVFLVTICVAGSAKNDNPQLSHFDGLAERSPFLALMLLLSLLSLAGIPPLVGFTGKWILFSAAMEKGHWFLVLWGVLNSVVSLFYYLTLVKHAYLEKPKDPSPMIVPFSIQCLGLFLLCAIVFFGVFPSGAISLAQLAISSAFIR